MKEYSFPDPDNEGYEIVIPKEIVKDIVIDYLKRTYYWSVGIFCIIIICQTKLLYALYAKKKLKFDGVFLHMIHLVGI